MQEITRSHTNTLTHTDVPSHMDFYPTQISRISRNELHRKKCLQLVGIRRVLAAGWHIRAIAMYAFVRFVRSV